MNATEQLAPEVGTAAACRAMGVSRATLYRRRNPSPETSCVRPTRRQPPALDEVERRRVLDLLHSPQFVDQSPAAVHAAILDEGQYLCSVRTMYRINRFHGSCPPPPGRRLPERAPRPTGVP